MLKWFSVLAGQLDCRLCNPWCGHGYCHSPLLGWKLQIQAHAADTVPCHACDQSGLGSCKKLVRAQKSGRYAMQMYKCTNKERMAFVRQTANYACGAPLHALSMHAV
jgi:hypothetical protein